MPGDEARAVGLLDEEIGGPTQEIGAQHVLSRIDDLGMVHEFIDSVATEKGGAVLAEIEISEGSGLAGQTIHDLLHWTRSVVVLGLQNAGGELLVGPPATTVLSAGDKLLVRGDEDDLERIRPASREAVS